MEPIAAQDDGSDAELLHGVFERRVIFGHTHVQFRRVASNGIELINPGSVGMPLDGDRRAAYALLHDDGAELRRVDYDSDAVADALDELDSDWGRLAARRLRAASFDA
jgi:hypothetical protein